MLAALLISLIAGLATSIGGLLVTHKKVIDRTVLSISLAVAAGAMIFLSFMEMMPKGVKAMAVTYDIKISTLVVFGAFFLGIVLVLMIDRLLPKSLNPSETGSEEESTDEEKKTNRRLLRSGAFVALVLALHNFPEGASTFAASYQNIQGGIVLAVAIALHNIPEGIAVAAPIYAATKDRKKALFWSTVSGLTEPLGALVMALLMTTFLPASLLGGIFGLVAGMMVAIALDELLPASWRYQTDKHQTIYGLLGGMLLVAVSVVLLSA